MNIKFKINKPTPQIRKLCIFLLFSIFIICGCTKYAPAKNSVDFKQITSAIESSIDGEVMVISQNTSKSLKRFFGLNISDYEDVLLYSPSSSMDVSELMILKLSDESQIDFIELSIENRVASQLESFSGYAPEQCDLLENYIIKIKNNYIFYAVGENSQDLKKAFIDAI